MKISIFNRQNYDQARKIKIILSFLIIHLFSCHNLENSFIGESNNVDISKFPFQKYDRIETYSFNRSSSFIDSISKEIINLKDDKRSLSRDSISYIKKLSSLNRVLENGEHSIIMDTISMKLATTSVYIKTLSKSEVKRVQEILRLEGDIFEYALCGHTYRDALIFKHKKNIVGWIDICFKCWDIKTYPDKFMPLKGELWIELKDFFSSIGHKIEK